MLIPWEFLRLPYKAGGSGMRGLPSAANLRSWLIG